jgi:hypothetical protein
MARGRFLEKDISLNEKVDKLSDDTARLLYTWLIPHLDYEGKMYADPIVFRSIVVPRRNISLKKIEKYLKEFEKSGLIFRYFVENNCYLICKNFEKHQPGLRKDRESESQIPPVPADFKAKTCSSTPDLIRNNSGVTPAQVKVKVKDKVKVKVKGSKVVVVNDEHVIPSVNTGVTPTTTTTDTTDYKTTNNRNNQPESTQITEKPPETPTNFDEFIENTKPEYPDLDLDEERQRFETYNRENRKNITDPQGMFLRWLARAREFATENVSSRAYPAYQTYQADDPAKYLTGKYQQFVMR